MFSCVKEVFQGHQKQITNNVKIFFTDSFVWEVILQTLEAAWIFMFPLQRSRNTCL